MLNTHTALPVLRLGNEVEFFRNLLGNLGEGTIGKKSIFAFLTVSGGCGEAIVNKHLRLLQGRGTLEVTNIFTLVNHHHTCTCTYAVC